MKTSTVQPENNQFELQPISVVSQPGGADYAHHSTTGSPGYSDLPSYVPESELY